MKILLIQLRLLFLLFFQVSGQEVLLTRDQALGLLFARQEPVCTIKLSEKDGLYRVSLRFIFREFTLTREHGSHKTYQKAATSCADTLADLKKKMAEAQAALAEAEDDDAGKN